MDGVTDRGVLAQELGVRRESLRKYYQRLSERANVPLTGTSSSEEQLEKNKDFVCKRLSRTHRYARALLGHLVTGLAPEYGEAKARLRYNDRSPSCA